MTCAEKEKCYEISTQYPFTQTTVEAVYDCVGDFGYVEKVLTFACQRAISPYVVIEPIQMEEDRKRAVEFKFQPLIRMAIAKLGKPKRVIGNVKF